MSGERPGDQLGSAEGWRIDDLSAETGISVRNIREYQDRGLLPAPRRAGRIAWYSIEHVTRLRLIDRLLRRGYTIAVIKDLVDAWAAGRDLEQVLGLEQVVSQTWSRETPTTMTLLQLHRLFGRQLTPAIIRRAVRLEIITPAGLRAFAVSSPDLLAAGADLVAAGIPLRTVLDVIENVAAELDSPAVRLIDMVYEHVFPGDTSPGGLPEGERVQQLAETVATLRPHALKAVDALMARSLARAVDRSFDRLTRQVSAAAPGAAGRPDAAGSTPSA